MPDDSMPFSPHAAAARPFDYKEGLRLPLLPGTSTEHATMVVWPEDPARTGFILTPAGRDIVAARLASHPPMTAWPEGFVRQAEALSHVRPPNSLRSWQFHLSCLMAHCPDLLLRRSDLQALKEAQYRAMCRHPHPEWFPALGEDSDVIQHVNKCSQWGAKVVSAWLTSPDGSTVTYYGLTSPLAYDRHCRSPRPAGYRMQPQLPACDCPALPSPAAADVQEVPGAETRRFLQENYLGPQVVWSGNAHRDPFNKELGTVAQPAHLNRKFRDSVKLDELGLPMAPTVPQLGRDLHRYYPAEWEREELLLLAARSLPPERVQQLLEDLAALPAV